MSMQRLLLTRQLTSNARCIRLVHQSAVVQKKKKSSAHDVDDMFASDSSEELFGSADKAAAVKKVPTQGKQAPVTATALARKRLSPEDRLSKFNELHAFVADRTGLKPAATTPEQVRKSAWQHLFSLSTTREQLESVTELFSKWRDSRKVFDERIVQAFVRRCEELHCPDLALQVFSNHSKYGFPITSLPIARQLMHSLHVEHPLSSAITLVALYKVYNLPPVSSDLVSTAMLASACFKSNTEHSLVVANALVPALKTLIAETSPIPIPPKGAERANNKETAWLAWTLSKIEKALVKQKEETGWLRDWRERSGHLSIAV